MALGTMRRSVDLGGRRFTVRAVEAGGQYAACYAEDGVGVDSWTFLEYEDGGKIGSIDVALDAAEGCVREQVK